MTALQELPVLAMPVLIMPKHNMQIALHWHYCIITALGMFTKELCVPMKPSESWCKRALCSNEAFRVMMHCVSQVASLIAGCPPTIHLAPLLEMESTIRCIPSAASQVGSLRGLRLVPIAAASQCQLWCGQETVLHLQIMKGS